MLRDWCNGAHGKFRAKCDISCGRQERALKRKERSRGLFACDSFFDYTVDIVDVEEQLMAE